MSKINLSIIIPTYNGEEFVSKCLDSVTSQTLKNIEIIVIDDNSTDDTVNIIEQYKARDCRIKTIYLEQNHGQGYARNRGIEIASGEYLGFVDSDDYIDLDFYEKLYNIALQYDADIATTNLLKHKKNFKKYNCYYNKVEYATDIHKRIETAQDKKKFFFYVLNKIYKTSVIKNNSIKFEEEHIYEDVIFSANALYYSKSIVSVPNTTYHYIKRKSSTINTPNSSGKKKQDLVLAYSKLQKLFKEKNINLPERLNYYTSIWYNPFVKTYLGDYKYKELLFGLIPIKKESCDFNFPVDLVFLWVDGNDKNWQLKKQYWIEQQNEEINFQAIDNSRYIENDELKYALRSVDKYLPWINNIYIVTDNQVPNWLDTNNKKIHLVFHNEFIPEKYLPLFNSEAIESFLPYIPNLSKYFIYGNDDMYINKHLNKFFFFDKNQKPIARLKHQVSKKYIETSMYSRTILLQQKFIKDKYKKSYPFAPHHNLDAYNRDAFIECLTKFQPELDKTRTHKFRKENDLQRTLVTYYMLAQNLARLKHYSRIDRYKPLIKRLIDRKLKHYSTDSIIINPKNKNPYGKISKYNPSLFCINDGEGVSNYDRQRMKLYLEERFPEKSSFEL